MDAMFVSPPPPAHGNSTKTTNTSAKGSETKFAPTLHDAINEQNTSSLKSSDTEDGSKTSYSDPQDSKNSLDSSNEEQPSSENTVASGLAEIKTASDQHDSVSSRLQLNSHSSHTAQIAVNIGSYINDVKQQKGPISVGEAISKLLSGSQNIKESGQEMSLNDIQQNVKTKDPAISHNEKSLFAAEQSPTRPIGKQNSSIQLNAGDSITISSSKSQTPPLIEHKFTPATVLEGLAARDNGRFLQTDTHGNGLGGYATDNQGQLSSQNDSLPLSAEKIAARITNIVFQQTPHNTGLRDGNQSLRQDWLGEFIEAKIDQFQGKSGSKTGQEFLSSDGEMSASNTSLTAAKGGEKTGETLFSQTLHVAAAGKQVTSGIELQRPGATNIMLSQFQENDILHQVTHRIRLTQHLQDSKLVMKLHPAELGNLKIDIHLKEGTINANILAQSQQVQEILERNMPRLRALMEEQGLKVNEIAINLDNDPTEKKNLFEEHLAQDDKGFANHKNDSSAGKFMLATDEVEEPEIATIPPQSRVNVLI